MTFSTDNIDRVWVTWFAAGMLSSGKLAAVPGMIQVSWKSSETDKLFQVYVNGRWGGVTSDPEQRKLLVEYEHSHLAAIEIIAVEPEEKYTDYEGQVRGFFHVRGPHVIVSWPKRGTIPLGSKVAIFGDGGTGEMDYENPLAIREVWEGETEKWGWGLDEFGQGDFGYSGTGSIGWGRGAMGRGEFGFDAEMQEFESETLTEGIYKFGIRTTDRLGNLAEEGDEVTVWVDPLPGEPQVSIESYDEQDDKLILRVQ